MFTLLPKALCALALVVLATATPAVASPVTATFEKVGPGIGSAGQYNWNTGSTTYEGIIYTPYGNGSSSANHIVMFCIERSQYISGGTTYNDYYFSNLALSPVPGPAMSAAAVTGIEKMWAQYRAGLDVGTATDKNEKSAAFQEAVWHLVDSGYNPSLSGNELTYYNTYLNSSTWLSGLANLASIVSSTHQDQIFELQRDYIVDPNGDIVRTPAPATLVVAALIAPALWLRRRSR